ncbi:MAG: D-alanyl-D-alanine carboxypeptidase [Spirochaetaceae bacterium]|jgi:D-alanyl-D-alanine carboxypeptidase (penicillin-binding protein 5/6)|nr:D-alanyl-D-alanine carboxypeptidase [Spirochaetaceae bacterium]
MKDSPEKRAVRFRREKKTGWIPAGIALFCFSLSFALILVYASRSALPPEAPPLSPEEQADFRLLLRNAGYDAEPLSALPYETIPPELTLYARSAILIDTATGSVLFEKNADEIIPPASMTKIAIMYVVFQEIARGGVSLSDVVELPPESWAMNAPPGSSLMFLEPGHLVTLEELIRGLAVASGNDAAVAVAYHISGSVEAFCRRMTAEMRKLGLQATTFVEPSGYSELNLTTVREFAAFARIYLDRFPESLELFHSRESMVYPRGENIPGETRSGAITGISRTLYATNSLVRTLEGCDGLKTGYIDESGYNIALTARRGGTRFLSVTMGGPGRNSAEGTRYRNADGTALMEWAFASFYTAREIVPRRAPVRVWLGTNSAAALVEPEAVRLTVPREFEGKLVCRLEVPEELEAPVYAGQQYGLAVYEAEGNVVDTIPLVADRTVEKGGALKVFMDTISRPFCPLFR